MKNTEHLPSAVLCWRLFISLILLVSSSICLIVRVIFSFACNLCPRQSSDLSMLTYRYLIALVSYCMYIRVPVCVLSLSLSLSVSVFLSLPLHLLQTERRTKQRTEKADDRRTKQGWQTEIGDRQTKKGRQKLQSTRDTADLGWKTKEQSKIKSTSRQSKQAF